MKKTAKRLLALMMALGLFVAALPATAEEPVDEWVPEVEEFDLGAIGADEISLEEAAAGDDAPLAAGEEIALESPEPAEEAAPACVVESEPYYCEPDTALTPEERFEGYVARYFYDENRVPMATDYACQGMNAAERTLYDLMKAEILKIADGRRTNTEIKISPSQLSLKEFYTPQELGLSPDANGDGVSKMEELVCNWKKVYMALSLDCLYELYFASGAVVYNPYMKAYDDALGTYVLKVDPSRSFTFGYCVLDKYRLNDSQHELDPTAVRKARQAAANARAIANKYADYPDYAKLYAYAAEVCRWVDYKAPEGSGTSGDLGPVIAVFDGDPETKVVCHGYAMAFQYLCGLADFRGDVRCIFVEGASFESHAWNVVHMDDGRNYLVDVTFMDSSEFNQEPTDALIAKWLNERQGQYFLCGGSGSVDGEYSVKVYARGLGNSSYTERYRYYTWTMTYTADELALAGDEYRPVGFMTIGSKTYYWGENGHFLTGLQKIGDTTLQFDSDGALLSGVAPGWQTIGGKRYYFDQKGTMATGWRKIGGKWYCFDGSGAVMTGWQRQSGVYYCFDASGAMLTGWQKSGGKWYYLNSSGAMATGWQRVGGQWYHFAGGGAMQTGWQKIGNYYYCFKNSGAMMTGWQQIGGKWYYFGGSGAMATGWQNLGGKWYCFASGGAMMTGWQAIGGRWYYFNASGAMMTGWQRLGGKWYYFSASGAMATGWQQIGGKWYYFGTSGAMVTGTQTIGGRVYTFNNSGVWVG